MATAVVVACVACGRAYDPALEGPGGPVADGGTDAAVEGSAPSDAGQGGGGTDGAVVDPDASSSDPAAGRARVFISSISVLGSFGGLGVADAKCAKLAADQGLVGVYKAWLSNVVADALLRIGGTGPWYRMDGTTVVFSSRTSFPLGPAFPILYNEKGGLVLGAPVWTGTLPSGSASSTTCENWTAGGGDGTIGESDKVGATWTEARVAPCSTQAHFICLRAD